MRHIQNINQDWRFWRQDIGLAATEQAIDQSDAVNLPHTWNAVDGQDGGNDYYRGTCWYSKSLGQIPLQSGDEAWLEFNGAAMTANVWLNGQHLACHQGGYSTFRVNITKALGRVNRLVVSLDNSDNRSVYPQRADFTFYGGLYRDVNLIVVPALHFALDRSGGPALQVTPVIEGGQADVRLEAWTSNAPDGTAVKFEVSDAGTTIGTVQDGKAVARIQIQQVHLWDGLNDPYLYTASASLPQSGDTLETSFGCRTFSVDPEKGFSLNGRSYPLCGVARHQDRQGVGCAIDRAMQDEDMALILEMGANTIRLAHYQHDQYFYNLCDRHGLVVWAEIPYITEHMPEARQNTLSQMTELVVQNYNHPSIVCWGLSNEITVAGGANEDIIDNHRLLNDLCHSLDSSRLTTMAHAFMLDPADPLVGLPDICSYNLYFGWYLGQCADNDDWFDEFHAKFPERVVGLSEYGADANPQYQNNHSDRGDWSETYQAIYHEHMLSMWQTRPYIWAMHVWNMFDFGADGRNEGGKPGQNQKGLVTFDRKIKKDAFYLYKAYLSTAPLIHLCGKRYVDRQENLTEIKIYSNQPSVSLLVDGQLFASENGDKIFRFLVPISSEHVIEARSGDLLDRMKIRYCEAGNPDYSAHGSDVVNWFDQDEQISREGFYSIKDSMADIKCSPEAAVLLAEIMAISKESFGDVAKAVTIPEAIQRKMDQDSLERMLKQVGEVITPDMIRTLNHQLNQIPKEV